jgi:hypothetical protein
VIIYNNRIISAKQLIFLKRISAQLMTNASILKICKSVPLEPRPQCAGEDQQFETNPQLSHSNKNVALGPRWVLDTKTDLPTDRRLLT